MDRDELEEFKKQELKKHIPFLAKHLDGWKDVGEDDAIISRLSGLSNITCKVKAKSKTVKPRHVIFRIFNNTLCESDVEGAVFKCLSDQGLGPV